MPESSKAGMTFEEENEPATEAWRMLSDLNPRDCFLYRDDALCMLIDAPVRKGMLMVAHLETGQTAEVYHRFRVRPVHCHVTWRRL